MNLLMTRWSSLFALSSLLIACSDPASPPADSGTVDSGAVDSGTVDSGTVDGGMTDTGPAIDRTGVDVPAIDVAMDVPGDIANDRGGDAGESCASAVEGAACSMEGQRCGGPCTDPCRFCNIFHCTSGRWTRMEIFPRPCEDGGTADGSVETADARMLWQAPGGFTAMGPAVMVDADGTVRVWDTTRGVELASPSAPTRTLHVTETAARDLFSRWTMADRSSLPHSGSGGECTGRVSFRSCADVSCRVESFNFNNAAQLAPELDPVRMWFEDNLASETRSAHPATYCRF